MALDEFCEEVATQYQWPQIIVAGDFNFVFDSNRDSLNRVYSNNEATLASTVESQMEERELTDSIHFNGQNAPQFTWRRANCCSRLDHIFVSTGLSSSISNRKTEWYSFGSSYDHASVTIALNKEKGIPRGRGFPKLFHSDINSSVAASWLANQLDEAMAQIPQHWNPHQSHDFIKMIL